jgi:cell division protein FtsZ
MGIGYGKGEKRVIEAVRGAVFSPLLETDIEGATGIIVNISGGEDMLLSEVTEACDIVRQVVDPTANIIFGTAFIPDKKDIEITIIATGFMDKNAAPARSVGSTPIVSGTPIATALYTAEDEVAPVEEAPVEEVVREEIVIQRPVFTRPEPIAPQPAPAPVVEAPVREEEIQSSRIDYTRSGKQVPAFLRRIRGDRQ